MSEEAKVRHTDEAIAIVSSGRKTDLIGRNGSVKIPKIDHNDSDMLSGTLLMSPISTNSLTQAPPLVSQQLFLSGYEYASGVFGRESGCFEIRYPEWKKKKISATNTLMWRIRILSNR